MINFLTLINQKFKHIPEEKIIQKLKDLDIKYGNNYKSVVLYLFIRNNTKSDDSIYYNKLAHVCLVNENNSFYSEKNMENLLKLDRESGGIVQI